MIISISGKKNSGKDLVGNIINYIFYIQSQYIDFGGNSTKDLLNESDFNQFMDLKVNYHPSQFKIKKWATGVREHASLLTGISVEDLEKEEVKNQNLPSQWDIWETHVIPFQGEPHMIMNSDKERLNKRYYFLTSTKEPPKFVKRPMTVRMLLQWLGTDAMRMGLHKNVWVNHLMKDYGCYCELKKDSVVGKTYSCACRGGWPDWIITDTRFPNEVEAVENVRDSSYNIRLIREGLDNADQHKSERALDNYDFKYVIENNGTITDLIVATNELLEEIGLIETIKIKIEQWDK